MTDSVRSPSSVSTCSVCSSDEVDDVPGVGLVCSYCGTALGESPIDISADIESNQTDKPDSWREYYSIPGSTEQHVADAFDVVESLGDLLDLQPEFRVLVANLYAEAVIATLTDGRPTTDVVAACVLIVGQQQEEVFATATVADTAEIEANRLRRLVRSLTRGLEIPAPIPEPSWYLYRLCAELSLGDDIREAASTTLSYLPNMILSGKAPLGFTCAALYLAADGAVTQRELAQAAGITGETIRVRLLDIESNSHA